MSDDCFFCITDRVGADSPYSRSFLDGYPLNPGHTLVIPKRHVARIESLPPFEAIDLWLLVDRVARTLAPTCDGVNIGVNSGPAAGQTVGHLHVHVIPRFDGDTADPRGGVRWVIPERANYWSSGS